MTGRRGFGRAPMTGRVATRHAYGADFTCGCCGIGPVRPGAHVRRLRRAQRRREKHTIRVGTLTAARLTTGTITATRLVCW